MTVHKPKRFYQLNGSIEKSNMSANQEKKDEKTVNYEIHTLVNKFI